LHKTASLLNRVLFFFLFISLQLSFLGQKECWVLFKYKGNFNYNITGTDSSELPVNPNFIGAIENTGAKILNKSRWLNSVFISADKKTIELIEKLPYTDTIIYGGKTKVSTCVEGTRKEMENVELMRKQISSMQGDLFMKEGLTAKGIKIGVLDVGFTGYKKTKELDHLIKNGRIIEHVDFSQGDIDLKFQRSHGTEVLSCLAGKADSANLGLATEADYYLAVYQKVSEMVEALEWFKEKGVQIINNSTKLDYSYYEKEDLTGEANLASRALAKAAENGILIFSSVGNEGANYWRSLVCPADANGVISVGSISPETGLRSDFSSLGPTYDKRLKPELCAVGETMVASQNNLSRENGTSFATPLIAGFAACALQLNPGLSKKDLYDHLLKSGNLYPYFDYSHGYGVPQASYFIKLKKPDSVAVQKEKFIQTETRGDTIFCFLKPGSLEKEGIGDQAFEPRPYRARHLQFRGKNIFQEGKYSGTAQADELKGKNYVYYHYADATGFLKKYAVMKMESENIFYVLKSAVQPGYVLRIYYRGDVHELKF
jgi:serine protease AprX